MIIRDAVEADLPAIVEIYNATVPTRMVTAELEPTTVEARRPWFREHSPGQYPFWVAELEGRVVGWLDFKKFLPRCAYRGTAEISVYVDQKFRRRGVAQHGLIPFLVVSWAYRPDGWGAVTPQAPSAPDEIRGRGCGERPRRSMNPRRSSRTESAPGAPSAKPPGDRRHQVIQICRPAGSISCRPRRERVYSG